MLDELPSNRAVVLDNVTCPYCGIGINEDNRTKEHVVGRRFIPKGTLNGHWNLIVRACGKCNSKKSYLENDISAITLAGKLWFGSVEPDEMHTKEVHRKAKNSISNKTRKPVLHSQEEVNIEIPAFRGMSMKLNMKSPPQLKSERIFELARMQIMAFFYFITYDQDAKKGGFWREGFYPLTEAHHGDWGNSLHKEFMTAVVTWEPRWVGITADGYFRSIIRRHPSAECWSWAVEWNKNYRAVGFFGSRNAAENVASEFKWPEMATIKTGEKSFIKFRKDIRLSEEEDLLFEWDDKNA